MNKVALITGGSRGIGLGIAKHLAASSFDLAINGIRPIKQVQKVVDELHSTGVDVIYCPGDIGNPKDRTSIVNRIKNHFGRLNVLVNNAGIAPKQRMDLLQTTEKNFHEVMRVNLHGTYFLTQSVAKWMIIQKQVQPSFNAFIINVTSISAQVASVNRGEYCISKAGLSMMTKLFAVRMGDHDIPVYEIQPGIIRTDMTAQVKEKYDKLIAGGQSLQRRWGTPDDVGRVAAALATGHFAFSTGQTILVDGGLTVARL